MLASLADGIGSAKKVCVALSGGVDSTLLLYLANQLHMATNKFILSAIHVNHGISPHADEWQEHCLKQCRDMGIPLTIKTLFLRKQARKSLESDARSARYQTIVKSIDEDCVVLLGQHIDDQAETFLIQLKRGSGIKGLSSMAKYFTLNEDTRTLPSLKMNELAPNKDKKIDFCRPLLGFKREQIESLARTCKVSWVEDESNQDQGYDRNFLRRSILPLLNKRWPHFADAVHRSSEHCANAQLVIDEYMSKLETELCNIHQELNIELLLRLSEHTRAQFVRYWLDRKRLTMPSAKTLDALLSICKLDAAPAFIDCGEYIVERFQNTLIAHTYFANKQRPSHLLSRGEQLCLENGESLIWLKAKELKEQALQEKCQIFASYARIQSIDPVRKEQVGEREIRVCYGETKRKARMQANRPSKSLKVWFQEWGVSPLERKSCPVILVGEQVVAVFLPRKKEIKVCLENVLDPKVIENESKENNDVLILSYHQTAT